MDDMKVTSIEELKEYAKGTLIRLPDFGEGQPFYARLRRPSMLALTKAGKIPNTLIMTANELFNGKGMDDTKVNAMPEVLDILDIMADACFVEPTYKEIQEAGVQLTDEQLMAVFSYTQRGVKALESFREESENTIRSDNSEDVQEASI